MKEYFFVILLFICCLRVNGNDGKAATATAAEYRLDERAMPIRYRITLKLEKDFNVTKKYSGNTEIDIEIKESTNSIRLNALALNGLSKDNITIHSLTSSNPLEIEKVNFSAKYEILTIQTKQKLLKNTFYTLNFKSFEGELSENSMHGFYKSTYIKGKDTRSIATTQFQPTYARKAFPCFDEPKFKALFDVILIYPEGFHALSNTPSMNSTIRNYTVTEVFATTPKMSTYTLAFIVFDFVQFNKTDKIHNVWSREDVIKMGNYSYDIGKKVLEHLENFTNIKFNTMLPKLDQVAIPDFSAGAMENWGLVTYRETALLYDPATSTKSSKQRVATVVAHEFAHMWFGNLVTLNWWSDTWLNEGLARYFEYFATAEVENSWDLENQFVVEQQQGIFPTDALLNTSPLSSKEDDIYNPAQISDKFSSLTYSKGGSIVRMMKHFLGEENFKTGLQNYLVNNKFNNTVPKNFFDGFNQSLPALPTKLGTIMESWIYESGYPMITVSLKDNTVYINQRRFKTTNETSTNVIWYVPITYTTSTEKKFKETLPKKWLTKMNDTLTEKLSGWILLNIGETAYYRVKYDEELLNRLKEALKKSDFDQIPPINRAQIIDDILNLARAKELRYSDALDLATYLENELNYYPWYSAFRAFNYLRMRFSSGGNIAKELTKYIMKLMTKFYESATFEIKNNNQIEVFRNVLALKWACEFNLDDCVKKSQKIFDDFKEKNATIQADIKSVVYCSALRHGNYADFNFLWEILKKDNPPADQVSIIITALGCSTNKTSINKFLNESITNVFIRPQDANTVFSSVLSGNPENIELAFKFLQTNFKQISQRYGGMNALSTVITSLADRLTESRQIEEFKKFVETNKDDLQDAASQAQAAIESAQANLAWVNYFTEDLEAYFTSKRNSAAKITTSIIFSIISLLTLRWL